PSNLRQACSSFTIFATEPRNLTGKRAIGDIGALVNYKRDNPLTAANEASVAFYPIERRAIYAGLRARL
ncbi:hypothetical protein FIV32_11810, partial [Sphingomonadales bacterium 58]|uniref:hypothetical protein n=1 Tax=Sphingobium sp. S8 TaxID=2758385 RepID=UPI0019184D12